MPEFAASPTNAFRWKILHNYHDHAQVAKPDNETNLQCGDEQKGPVPVGRVKDPFPTKLHYMLSKVQESGLRHIVSWWDPLHFVCVFLLRYATQTNKQCFYCIRNALWCTSRRNLLAIAPPWRCCCDLLEGMITRGIMQGILSSQSPRMDKVLEVQKPLTPAAPAAVVFD